MARQRFLCFFASPFVFFLVAGAAGFPFAFLAWHVFGFLFWFVGILLPNGNYSLVPACLPF